MNLFYNPKGVGDVAFIQIEPSVGPFEYEQKHGVVEIKKENEVVGYNIFNAVSYTHLTLPTICLTCRSRWSPYH